LCNLNETQQYIKKLSKSLKSKRMSELQQWFERQQIPSGDELKEAAVKYIKEQVEREKQHVTRSVHQGLLNGKTEFQIVPLHLHTKSLSRFEKEICNDALKVLNLPSLQLQLDDNNNRLLYMCKMDVYELFPQSDKKDDDDEKDEDEKGDGKEDNEKEEIENGDNEKEIEKGIESHPKISEPGKNNEKDENREEDDNPDSHPLYPEWSTSLHTKYVKKMLDELETSCGFINRFYHFIKIYDYVLPRLPDQKSPYFSAVALERFHWNCEHVFERRNNDEEKTLLKEKMKVWKEHVVRLHDFVKGRTFGKPEIEENIKKLDIEKLYLLGEIDAVLVKPEEE
jgi:hypothetical protein